MTVHVVNSRFLHFLYGFYFQLFFCHLLAWRFLSLYYLVNPVLTLFWWLENLRIEKNSPFIFVGTLSNPHPKVSNIKQGNILYKEQWRMSALANDYCINDTVWIFFQTFQRHNIMWQLFNYVFLRKKKKTS